MSAGSVFLQALHIFTAIACRVVQSIKSPSNASENACAAYTTYAGGGPYKVGLTSIPVEAAGTPGESGRPRVATPEPACTRKESACPW